MKIPVTILAILVASQASAQAENKITVSGRAWGSVENMQATGATNGNNIGGRFRVTNDSSYLRVRGDLKLSDDLSAWGVVEAQFAFDGVAPFGPFDSMRNTGAGFTSKTFGTLMAGRWDTPYKLALINLDPWGDTTAQSYANILGQLVSGGNVYDARFSNSIQYWTPVISGLQAKVGFEVNEDKSASAVGPASSVNPWAISASVTYDGPIFVGVTYESRKDCSNAGGSGSTAIPSGTPLAVSTPANVICTGSLLGTHGTDQGLRAGVGYNNKPTFTQIGFIYENLTSQATSNTDGSARKLARDAYFVSIVQGLGGNAHQIVGYFEYASKATGSAANPAGGTGADAWNIAYRYNFTKDLMVHFGYMNITNRKNASYKIGNSGLTGAAATSGNPGAGADYQGWVLGSRYVF